MPAISARLRGLFKKHASIQVVFALDISGKTIWISL